jgi:hypothetical protein
MAFLLLAYLANLRRVPPSVTALYTASIVGVLVIAAWAGGWIAIVQSLHAPTDDLAPRFIRRPPHVTAPTLAAGYGLIVVTSNRFKKLRSTGPPPRRHAHSTAAEACSGSGDPLHNGCTLAATRQSHCGSNYGVGRRFQSCRINDLEMVAQICPGWNRLQEWFELVGAFKGAA